jgi:hypothetical protein
MNGPLDPQEWIFHDVPTVDVFCSALKADLAQAIVIGRTKEGKLHFSGSTPNVKVILAMIDEARLHMTQKPRS